MAKLSESQLRNAYNKWHIEVSKNMPKSLKKNSFLRLLEIQPGRSLLDVACGKGEFLYSCISKGLKLSGIDISQVAIQQAKNILPSDVVLTCGNAENLPYNDESFDYVTCLGSLEHFLDPEKGIREIARVLKRGGRALFFLPNLYFVGHIYLAWRHGIEPSEADQQFSENFKTRLGWQNMIERNGLKVISIHKFNKIYKSKKVGRIIFILYSYVFRFFIPFNLSYAFAYVCTKKD